jgi:hypothetical protein
MFVLDTSICNLTFKIQSSLSQLCNTHLQSLYGADLGRRALSIFGPSLIFGADFGKVKRCLAAAILPIHPRAYLSSILLLENDANLIAESIMRVCRRLQSERAFGLTAATPAELLAELRQWAGTKSHKGLLAADYPLHLAGDAGRVAAGEKTLLVHDTARTAAAAASSTFRFDCTACGSCCRAYSSSVMLDPHDLFLMAMSPSRSMAASAGHGPHKDVIDERPGAFELLWGLHDADAFPPSQPLAFPGGPGTRPLRGIVPVLYLKPKASADAPGDVRCQFSVPQDKQQDGSSGAVRGAPAAGRRGRTGSSAAKPARLSCSFGPANMPYACSLYPLGEFWRNNHPRIGSELVWYSLDQKGCEGVDTATGERGAGGGTETVSERALRTLQQYRDGNQLEGREGASLWFRQIATLFACSDVMERVVAGVRSGAISREAAALWRQQQRSGLPASVLPLPPWPQSFLVEKLDSKQRETASSLLHALGMQLAAVWYRPAGTGSGTGAWVDAAKSIEKQTQELEGRWRTWLSSMKS